MQASRRQLLSSCVAGISFACIQGVYNADATMMSLPEGSDAKLFSDSAALGKDKALERFKIARNDLNYLLEHFSVISEGGGDNIRRYLGTVGVTSGMYGIPRVMKELQEEANDIIEYTENMNDFDAYLRQADTSCYSANFVEFSAAKTKPEKFFQDAKSDAQQMKIRMDAMAVELGL